MKFILGLIMVREYIIYAFIDENNKPFYIGQTYNLKMRMNAHNQYILDIEEKRHPSTFPYYRKARKMFLNGINLKVDILESNLTKQEADIKEAEYIKQYRFDESCTLLNILDGGIFNQRNKFVSEDTKRKISAAKKGKKLSDKHKESLKNCVRKKREWTEEQLQKYSENTKRMNTGRKLSPEHIEKIRQSKIGKKHSDETKNKIGRTGKDHSTSKHYKLISPDGIEYDLWGLSKSFIEEHNLNQSGLYQALKENRKYKKWQIELLD